uniref:C2H2-type domain-containing protein n=1 Tax=Echinostoma caproni TaxID=27848 RepID=A0A183AMR8_9TREM
LFHALGKILYGKRQKSESAAVPDSKACKSTVPSLPLHLTSWKRPPLTFDLDDVLEQCQMSGDQIMSWLHENFPDFMPNMSAIEWVSQHMSWADSCLSGGMNWRLGLTPAADWNTSDTVAGSSRPFSCGASRHYGALVVIRALLLAHDMIEEEQSSSGSPDSRNQSKRGFRPLRGPFVHDAWKSAQQRRDALSDLTDCSVPPFDQLCGFTQFRIANRCHWLYDFLPLVSRIKPIRERLDKDRVVGELIDSISFFGPTSVSDERRMRSVIDRKPVHTDDSDRICPLDAISEGDALPIEEDVSDEERNAK